MFSVGNILDIKNDIAMQQYIVHNISCAKFYFYEKDSELSFKEYCSTLVQKLRLKTNQSFSTISDYEEELEQNNEED